MSAGVAATSKTQIDLLGDRLRKGAVSDDDLTRLDSYRGSFAEAYGEVVAAVRASTHFEPTGRPAKSTSSIVEKLRRETIRLSQMQDIAGCRLVVEDILAQDQVVERLKGTFAKVVVVDRRKEPSYGYRAVHAIPTVRNRPVEIQVRTELQHLWAQLSERLSDTLDPTIKYGGGDRWVQGRLSATSKLIGELEERDLQPGSVERDLKLAQIKAQFREYLREAIIRGLDAL